MLNIVLELSLAVNHDFNTSLYNLNPLFCLFESLWNTLFDLFNSSLLRALKACCAQIPQGPTFIYYFKIIFETDTNASQFC